MQRHWRRFAERAGNPACPMQEVGEALVPALKREFAAAPIDDVRDIFGAGGKQASLFAQERITQLEALRAKYPGSAAEKTLIDCAVEVAASGQMGEAAVSAALESAAESRTRDCFRSVEEHYQREGSSREAVFMRERLNNAKGSCDYKKIASDLSAGGKQSAASAKIEKRSGIDDGPAL
jgi:hypothetical protein